MATWKPPHVPAHRKPRGRLDAAQLAPSHPMQPVVCTCTHLRLIHRNGGQCLYSGCDCTTYQDTPPNAGPNAGESETHQ